MTHGSKTADPTRPPSTPAGTSLSAGSTGSRARARDRGDMERSRKVNRKIKGEGRVGPKFTESITRRTALADIGRNSAPRSAEGRARAVRQRVRGAWVRWSSRPCSSGASSLRSGLGRPAQRVAERAARAVPDR